jgi:hypothetical protein
MLVYRHSYVQVAIWCEVFQRGGSSGSGGSSSTRLAPQLIAPRCLLCLVQSSRLLKSFNMVNWALDGSIPALVTP